MQEQQLIDEAGALLARLAEYAAMQEELYMARELVRQGCYRAVGPHRMAANARRLTTLCEQARALLDGAR